MKRSRRLFLFATIVTIVILSSGLGMYWYFTSGRAAARAAAYLQQMLGEKVLVQGVDVGASSSTLSGIAIFEPDASGQQKPWLQVAEVEADLSVWDLLRGLMPQRLVFRGISLTLRFDAAGNLLTLLPKGERGAQQQLPAIRIENARVEIDQAGRQPMIIESIGADLAVHDGRYKLTGQIRDSYWKDWSVEGASDLRFDKLEGTLRAERMHVTEEMLRRLPFVPSSIWDEVPIEGDTPVTFTVRALEQGKSLHYRVAIAPSNTSLRVAAIDLAGEQARGEAIIEDGRVSLRGVAGKAADGLLSVSGELDFRTASHSFAFTVKSEQLEVKRLPRSWNLPTTLAGRLNGDAKLKIISSPSGLQTSGSGLGVISAASVAGVPADPIRLELATAREGFCFITRTMAGNPIVLPTIDLPPEIGPFGVFNALLQGLEGAYQGISAAGLAYYQRTVRVVLGKSPTEVMPSTVEANLRLHDVDIAKLLTGLNITLPFTLAGKISVDVQAVLPVDQPRNWQGYRVDGTANASQLIVQGFTFDRLQARVAFRHGVVRVEELNGIVPSLRASQPSTPNIRGHARLPIEPSGDFTAGVQLTDIALAEVAKAFPQFALKSSGSVTGSFEARVRGGELGNLDSWNVSAKLAARDVAVEGINLGALQANGELASSAIALRELTGTIYEGQLSGKATIPLSANRQGALELRITNLNAASLGRDMPTLPLRIQGRANASLQGSFSAAFAPTRQFAGKLELNAPRLLVQGIPTEKLEGSVAFRQKQIEYHLSGESLGGTFQIDGKYPENENPKPEASGRMQVRRVMLTRLWRAVGLHKTLGQLRGTADLDVAVRFDDGVPSGKGKLVVRDLRWGRTMLADSDLTGRVIIQPYELRLQALSGSLAEGFFRVSSAYRIDQPDRSWFNIALTGASAARLLEPWPDWAARVQGLLDVNIRGTMGRTWQGFGTTNLARGRLLGLEVGEVRLPWDFWYSVTEDSGEINLRESTLTAARGTVAAKAQLKLGWSSALEGNLRFHDIDLQKLLSELGETKAIGAGKVHGRFDFKSNNVLELDELTGSLEAKLQQAQALRWPVLGQLTPFLALGQSPNATFDSGELRAFLRRGVIRVERLTLVGQFLNLFIEGVVTLQGRLDLHVTANTGPLASAGPQGVGGQIARVGVFTTGLFGEVTRYLASRLIRLHITGTIRNPSIQIQPLPILTDELARFFLGSRR